VIRHQVLTIEKAPFTYRVAGLGSRFLAWLIDLFVLMGLDWMGALGASVLIIGRILAASAVLIGGLILASRLVFTFLHCGQCDRRRHAAFAPMGRSYYDLGDRDTT
jgi:uncharacterized RDD family membrane protein YckC